MIAAQVLLDRLIPWLKNPAAAGACFSVNIVDTAVLRHGVYTNLPSPLFVGRKQVALKTLLLSEEGDGVGDAAKWKSMVTEYQILNHHSLARHPSIVPLLGIAWRTIRSERRKVAPVMILEAAEHGSLANFNGDTLSSLTPSERLPIILQICKGVASGLSALHHSGIVHGDMKSDNVLIFNHPNSTYVAKLSDFGSAIVIPNSNSTARLSGGTPHWQAPEYNSPLQARQLIFSDIYSFGMLVLDTLLAGGSAAAMAVLEEERTLLATREDRDPNKSTFSPKQLLAYQIILKMYQSEGLANLVRDCLAVRPGDRPDTMEIVLERIHDIISPQADDDSGEGKMYPDFNRFCQHHEGQLPSDFDTTESEEPLVELDERYSVILQHIHVKY